MGRSKIFFAVLLISLQPFKAFSQMDNVFGSELTKMRCTFKKSNGFVSSGYAPAFSPRPKLLVGGFQQELTTESGDVRISITVYYNDSTRKSVRGEETYKKMFRPDFDRNKVYLSMIRAQIDPQQKIIFFDTTQLKLWNADVGALYSMVMQNRYQEKYSKCKVLYLFKKNRGDVVMYYFYNDGIVIDDYINATKQMFEFLD